MSDSDRIGAALLAVPAVFAASYLLSRYLSGDWAFPFPYAPFWLVTWGLASLAAAILAATGYGVRRAAGLGLMLVPVAIAAVGFLNSLETVLTRGTVAPPRSTYRLSSQYSRAILIDIGYLGTGFLLWGGWTPRDGIGSIAARLRDVAPRITARGEGRSALVGYAWFPVVLGAAALMDWTINQHVPAVITGDDSRVWSLMTPYHAVMLAAAAAVTEELVYRLLILGGTIRVLQDRGMRSTPAITTAMVVQVLVFGMAHGGYGDLQIMLQATAFALVTGFAALLFGIWAAIALHFLMNFFVFSSYVAADSQAMLVTLWVLLAVNVVVAVGVAWRSVQDRPESAGAS